MTGQPDRGHSVASDFYVCSPNARVRRVMWSAVEHEIDRMQVLCEFISSAFFPLPKFPTICRYWYVA